MDVSTSALTVIPDAGFARAAGAVAKTNDPESRAAACAVSLLA
ncbi:MAG: hypothetical protein ACYYKD_01525 [Rhodospirillales bacterium]